jgi:serine/threonine protein kinase
MDDWVPPGYTQLDRMGSGSFGRVELIKRDSDDVLFALKVLMQQAMESAEPEIEAMQQIDSPFVCRLHDVYRMPNQIALRPDPCIGGTLRQRIQRARESNEPLEVPEILNLFTQILLGLREVHRLGIVHRDLGPGNILFVEQNSTSEYGRIQIIDFGVSGFLTKGKLSGSFGTPHYMSPEVAAGKVHDTKSDIYSIGVIMYEMSELKLPPEPGPHQLTVHPCLSAFVSRLLSANPDDRPTVQKCLNVKDIKTVATTFEGCPRMVLHSPDYVPVKIEFGTETVEFDIGGEDWGEFDGAATGFGADRANAVKRVLTRAEGAQNVEELREQDRQAMYRRQEAESESKRHKREFAELKAKPVTCGFNRSKIAIKGSITELPIDPMSEEERLADDAEKTRLGLEKSVGLETLTRVYRNLVVNPALTPIELCIGVQQYNQIARLIKKDRDAYG